MTWEDCDAIVNPAVAPIKHFGMGASSVDSSMLYQNDFQQRSEHMNMAQPQFQLLQQQQQQHMNTTAPEFQQGSSSPSPTSSPNTILNAQVNSPSYASPIMQGEVQIKADPYMAVVGQNNQGDYLYKMQPENAFQQQQNQTSLSPPGFQSAPKSNDQKTRAKSLTTKSEMAVDDSNSNEEDDIMVKRKAQNRAAQRAFRERKEQRVRELEEKLSMSEKEKLRLASENERLKKENTVITTENQVLMATTDKSGTHKGQQQLPLRAHFPVHTFSSLLLADHVEDPNSSRSTGGPSFVVYQKNIGDVMLGAGAVWEQIMDSQDPDDIDVEYVMELLKGKEVCDGFGPVFRQKDVTAAIAMARQRA